MSGAHEKNSVRHFPDFFGGIEKNIRDKHCKAFLEDLNYASF